MTVPSSLEEAVTQAIIDLQGNRVSRWNIVRNLESAMDGRPERVESREGMLIVYDALGNYAGCIGSETWQRLLAEGAADSAE